MILNDCRTLLRQVKRNLEQVDGKKLEARTGFDARAERIGSVTICPGDFQHIEDVQHDLKQLFIDLWSVKDYLVEL